MNSVVKQCKRSIRIAAQAKETSIVQDNKVFVDGDVICDVIEKLSAEIERLEALTE